jgi:hypothetical protein
MVLITPGADMLLRASVGLGAFVGCASTAATILGDRLGYEIPTWVTAIGCIVSIPIILTVTVLGKKLSVRRRAWAAGARLVPEAQGLLPGNVDIVQKMMQNLKTGYPGEHKIFAVVWTEFKLLQAMGLMNCWRSTALS